MRNLLSLAYTRKKFNYDEKNDIIIKCIPNISSSKILFDYLYSKKMFPDKNKMICK